MSFYSEKKGIEEKKSAIDKAGIYGNDKEEDDESVIVVMRRVVSFALSEREFQEKEIKWNSFVV